ncbi:HD domain-containing protein [Clostridium sp. SHJSY1]|uniref:HD-GYP domain-containing protein n=1 Tax=Clostridium sp. SHJSY1 TaxID=2942483 RepID=UPI002875941B|nr:HD domain-containing phosphohydrolase [Clostridium sp. SHJSY1]MDS0525990.1 HD domain-containing protein [Clostridium sp. SHJSY1]
MKLVLANDKLVGEVLANPIYTESGMLFLNKGNKISDNVIKRLKKMGVATLYIEDGNDEITLQEALPAPIKLKTIKALKALFEEIRKKEHIDEKKVIGIINEIINNINLSENATIINNLIQNDELSQLAVHSLDVTILTLMVGSRKNYDNDKLVRLCTAALLHDIGRLFIDEETHVKKAYELLKRNPSIMSTTYMAVYNMYEREDGKGLFGVSGGKIHEFAKILGICNEYIDYVYNSKKEEAMLPHVAMERIAVDAMNRYGREIYMSFAKSVYCYPNGLQVKLNNGKIAVVTMQNKGVTTRPILVINSGDKFEFCNLIEEKNLTLFIEEVII